MTVAKKSSQRVMDIRKRNCDRVSFVIDKDAKHLIRAQALREGVSSAEVMRRAILARCGLEEMPNTADKRYQPIKDAVTKADAEKAITGLQALETEKYENKREWEKELTIPATIMFAGRNEKIRYITSLLELLQMIRTTPTPAPVNEWQAPMQIDIRRDTIPIIRRMLSNVEIPDDDDEIGDDDQ